MIKICLSLILTVALLSPSFSFATTKARIDIPFWHSMAGHLGEMTNLLVNKFNASQDKYRVVPIYKGHYPVALRTLKTALQTKKTPALVQIYEIGTASMIYPKGAILPFYQLMKEYEPTFDTHDFAQGIRRYYADAKGRLLAMPFYTSAPLLYYNKEAFQKAGIKAVPRTWLAMEAASKKLLEAGYRCGFTTAYPSWIQLESFTAWHNLPFASKQNGFASLEAKALYNHPIVLRHIAAFAEWQLKHIFHYGGRGDDAAVLFTSEYCGMLMQSSADYVNLLNTVGFPLGVSTLPYWADVPGAPQNLSIGGAALWVLRGQSKEELAGVAKFLSFLASPKIQTEWQEGTGYAPTHQSAYQLKSQAKFYQHPALHQSLIALNYKPATSHSHGIRLGNFMQIRAINNEELEAIWLGKKTARQGLRDAVRRANVLLARFSAEHKEITASSNLPVLNASL